MVVVDAKGPAEMLIQRRQASCKVAAGKGLSPCQVARLHSWRQGDLQTNRGLRLPALLEMTLG